MCSSKIRLLVIATCLNAFEFMSSTHAALADHFTVPKGKVILTVTGQITQHNADSVLKLDIDQLSALPQHIFTTSTVWTTGKSTFTGVLLKDLIAAVGAGGSVITLSALNDYQVTLPAAEVADDGPMLAYMQDGKPMKVRDKGPIWLVYPYDDNPDYRMELIYSRSIWQLVEISFSN